MRIALCALALLALTFPVAAKEGDAPKPLPHSDKDVKIAEERFKQDFASEDMDVRLRILRWYGQYMHKSVLKKLKKIWLKSKDVELQAAAAAGLGNQLPFARPASQALMEGIKKYEAYASRDIPEGHEEEAIQEREATALANALISLGKLGIKPDKKGWKMIRGLIDHHHDEVAIAMLQWCGATKEWRSLPIILEWFNFYPDGYSWSGGSVSVDTGAPGTKDAKAAKAKWKAKYGSKARKARPKAHAAMRQALKDITGQEFKEPKDLKAWMDENKALLKKHGV